MGQSTLVELLYVFTSFLHVAVHNALSTIVETSYALTPNRVLR